jgi:Mg/Co/Ni transporter MgtE
VAVYPCKPATINKFSPYLKGITIYREHPMAPVFSFVDYCLFYQETASGAGIPLILTKVRIDPAVASAVVVTTCTDVIGFLLFLGLATALVSFLL